MEKQDWIDKGIALGTEYGIKIITAIVIWIIGSWIIKKMMKGTDRIMSKRNYDPSLK